MELNNTTVIVACSLFAAVSFCIGVYRNTHWVRNRLDLLRHGYRYLNVKEIKVLGQHFSYYRKLSPLLKRVYENRVAHFVRSKSYVDAQGEEVSEKKKILIAAYAAQFTFGLRDFKFSSFNKIVVYPTRFFSPISNEFKSWDIDPSGTVHVSWKEFYMGLKNKENFGPVGLYVMAHLLRYEKQNKQLNELNMDGFAMRVANKEQAVGLATEKGIFEQTDLADNDHFFVACLIKFFEKPLEFRNSYPGLFRDIDRMLHPELLKQAS